MRKGHDFSLVQDVDRLLEILSPSSCSTR